MLFRSPGVAHYLIHSYDAPPIADQGLNAALRYAGIAPDAPHALHMPSHIFTRVGAWEESAATNARSARAAKSGGEPDEAYHASDYMTYAYLQLARDNDAKRTIEDVMKVTNFNAARNTAPYAIAAMNARYAYERGAWKELTQLEARPSKFHYPDAITYFGRAIGAARTGDAAAAGQEALRLETIHKALQAENNNYWATEVEIQRLAVAGWIALVRGDADKEAISNFMTLNWAMTRPVAAGPGVPDERVAALRRAFDATMKDPEFLDEARRMTAEIDPMTSEEAQAAVTTVLKTPAALVGKVQAILDAVGK